MPDQTPAIGQRAISAEMSRAIVDTASRACSAFWNDEDETRLRREMVRLADLFRAVRVTAEVEHG